MIHLSARRGIIDGGAAILALFFADLIVRTSYQIGKAPVLTVLAMNINAAPLLLGTIASISTATGLVFKPLFGVLSDRLGRRLWLAVGTLLFAGVPLLYSFVDSPANLVALRLFHGLATAIYGPITLAYVAAVSSARTAETFGWFGLARVAANVVGPLVGGAALTIAQPEFIYSATGLFASLALICLVRLGEPHGPFPTAQKPKRIRPLIIAANRTILLIGTTEATVHVAIYAVKGFAPVLFLMNGSHPITVGMFLATQEAVAALIRPAMGRLADKTNVNFPMLLGIILISIGLISIGVIGDGAIVILAAAFIGSGQGAFGPAALSYIAKTVPKAHFGLAYGVIGSLRNGGKIIGPIVAGGMTAVASAQVTFVVLAIVPLIATVPLLYMDQNNDGSSNISTRKVSDGQA